MKFPTPISHTTGVSLIHSGSWHSSERAELEVLGQRLLAEIDPARGARGAALPGFKRGIHGGHLTRATSKTGLLKNTPTIYASDAAL